MAPGDLEPEPGARRAEALLRAAEDAAAAARAAAEHVAPPPSSASGATAAGDPASPTRLLALADELDAIAHDAVRRLDDLETAVGALLDDDGAAAAGEAAAPFTGPTPDDALAATARLVAVEMALAGAERADVAEVLQRAFGLEESGALLDDVFGRPG